ncbi:NADP-dependent aryl-alcohol dehydrogenase [Platysternon megacephalum]|uniref:NADP-dependent aryl-alcohol dehydrogenase n=1 Tax=Platysternon megacephalum TaxID=55544 RepID=A0A4D9DIP2_9SAUR|nr:NADP-dependent aryl-alcohol dehydrogenase [Platysternon megacephalum]
MATPGMNWQQHYYGGGGSSASAGKFAASSSQPGLSVEYSQDLHLKMSKKIAQLTKVSVPPPSSPTVSCLLLRAALRVKEGGRSALSPLLQATFFRLRGAKLASNSHLDGDLPVIKTWRISPF